MFIVKFNDIGDDGMGYMVLVEDLGEEAREDDVGIGAHQIVFHQTRILIEETFTTATVVG